MYRYGLFGSITYVANSVIPDVVYGQGQFFQGVESRTVNIPNVLVTLIIDASKVGWGTHIGLLQVNGQWEKEMSNKHINWLDFKALFVCLFCFVLFCFFFFETFSAYNPTSSGNVASRNSTVASYGIKQGGSDLQNYVC